MTALKEFFQPFIDAPTLCSFSPNGIIKIYDINKSDFFIEIHADDIDSPEKLIQCIDNLTEKSWITTSHIRNIIGLAKYSKVAMADDV